MSDPASVDHEAAADILEDIEANPHAHIQSVDTDVSRGHFTDMVVEIAVKYDPDAESDTAGDA